MKSKKKSTEEKGPHPYDFTLKKETRDTSADGIRPIKAADMATGLVQKHSLKKALEIVEPLTVSSFKDKDGNPVTANESAGYWKTVFNFLKSKGSKNAIAS